MTNLRDLEFTWLQAQNSDLLYVQRANHEGSSEPSMERVEFCIFVCISPQESTVLF